MDRIAANAFLTAGLFRQGAAIKADLTRASQEMTTGKKADTGAAVGGDFSSLAAIDHALARIRGYSATTAETGLLAESMQTALGVVSTAAEGLSANLLRNLGLSVPQNLTAVTIEGRQQFETAIAALNTRFAERSVFGGVVTETAPLPDANTILASLEAALAGAVTVSDAETAIADWFDGATGYEAMYQGGAARAAVPVAPGESVDLPVTALDPAIRDTLKGLATVALLDLGLFTGQNEARAQLARNAGVALVSSGEARSVLAARIGTAEADIADTKARNDAEETALGIARAGLLEADPYETATRLEDLQARLESLYVLTARLSKLTLTDYLR
ncbi:flagellar biosynthesis protein FlgL [Rhodobacter sp. Har01]|uniref:flagellar biosynthesis protein FlgL n=1 Tax=Rhodobacter sp. Har01 TaxID=2883999 RepID=UPI001D05FEC2|nr:flagellar biosynthesis protein FlgL [Rhodobacter sp. Har01]MCB6177985.1 flagellar biosynthesis protein FlgL [Rhodobacter sp. Har01]